MPGDEKAAQRIGIDRLDLLPQAGKRSDAEAAQHAGIDPLAPAAAGSELAFHQLPGGGELQHERVRHAHAKAISRGELTRGERPVRSRIAQREIARGIAHRLEQRLGQSGWQRHAERVTVAGDILDRDVPALVRNRQRHETALEHELANRAARVGDRAARVDLVDRQVADAQQQIVQSVLRAHLVLVVEVLQLPFERDDRLGVEQLAQLRLAEQLAQLRLVHRQRLRAALGQRRVAVVDVVGDVAEEERGGKRRRHPRGRRSPRAASPRRPLRSVSTSAGMSKWSRSTSHRFRAAREGSKRAATAEEIGGALALLPERRAHAGPPPRQEQRARRGLAKPGREERRRSELTQDQRPRPRQGREAERGSGGCSTSGKRTTKPSSPHMTSTSMPVRLRIWAVTAIAHGA